MHASAHVDEGDAAWKSFALCVRSGTRWAFAVAAITRSTASARPCPTGSDRCPQASRLAGDGGVERERLEGRLDDAETLGAPSALVLLRFVEAKDFGPRSPADRSDRSASSASIRPYGRRQCVVDHRSRRHHPGGRRGLRVLSTASRATTRRGRGAPRCDRRSSATRCRSRPGPTPVSQLLAHRLEDLRRCLRESSKRRQRDRACNRSPRRARGGTRRTDSDLCGRVESDRDALRATATRCPPGRALPVRRDEGLLQSRG